MTISNAGKTPPDLAQLQAAVTHFQRAEFVDALHLLKAIPSHSPFHFDSLHLQGTVYYKNGEYERSIALLKQARRLNAENAQLINTLASCYLALNVFEQAIEHYQHALKLAPDYIDAANNLMRCRKRFGFHLLERGDYSAASEQFQQVLLRNPDDIDARLQLAFIFQQTGQLESACEYYEQLLKTFGVDSSQHVDIEQIRNARDGNDLIAKCLYNLAIIHLTQGDYQNGWPGYGARPSLFHNTCKLYQQPLPNQLAGKNILVIHDQGLGDELFFLRYLALLQKRGAEVDYKPHPKLAKLLNENSPLGIKEHPVITDYDYAIAVGDLPFVLNEVMPVSEPLVLNSEVERTATLKKRLTALGPPPYLGISWRAGTASPDNELATSIRKAIPLNELTAALKGFEGTLCILQRHPTDTELATLNAASGLHVADFSALNEDLQDMLSLLSLLDDYIGVSNTNMHLRGSLNLPAAVLIPYPPEWRWKVTGQHTDWYKSFELYREQDHSWSKACDAVQQRVRSLTIHG